MPELNKIESSAAFTPEAGNIVTYFASESDKIVLKAKKSDGTVQTLSGSSIVVGGDAEYYKCASVDTASKTWTGYLAVLTDGVYTFEETATEGLTYGDGFTPEVNRIYSADALVAISSLWTGVDPALVFWAALTSDTTAAETGQVMVNNGNVTFSHTGALFTGDNYLEISDVSALPFEGSPLTMYAELQFTDISMQFNHLLTLGNELGFRYYSGLEVFWNGGSIQASTQVDTASIYRACVTYDGVTISFYVDGVLAGLEQASLDVSNNGSFRIGGLPRYGNGKGYVRNVRVYNRCLSADEIAELANA